VARLRVGGFALGRRFKTSHEGFEGMIPHPSLGSGTLESRLGIRAWVCPGSQSQNVSLHLLSSMAVHAKLYSRSGALPERDSTALFDRSAASLLPIEAQIFACLPRDRVAFIAAAVGCTHLTSSNADK
jgi:hypothetical protein